MISARQLVYLPDQYANEQILNLAPCYSLFQLQAIVHAVSLYFKIFFSLCSYSIAQKHQRSGLGPHPAHRVLSSSLWCCL